MKQKYNSKMKLLNFFVLINLLYNSETLKASGIIVDSTVDKNYQSDVTKTKNQVDHINIVTPSSSGTSHNKFLEYNVSEKGVILNNSRADTNTILGGRIPENPNLNGKEANLIITEVTGNKLSNILGYTEIAGKKADYILANPNGIHVNGAGFLNTRNVTLTTGSILNDPLLKFKVKKGLIEVGEKGVDTGETDYFTLISKTAKISGVISSSSKENSKEVKIITGSNDVNYNTKEVEAISSEEDSEENLIGIDTGDLGGIIANKITLISNDKGVGVNIKSPIIAEVENISINSMGNIILKSAKADKGINLKAEKNIDIVDKGVLSSGAIDLKAKEKISNAGIIYGKENIGIKGGSLKNTGRVLSKNIDLNFENSDLNFEGDILSTEKTVVNSKKITFSEDLLNEGSLELNASEEIILPKNILSNKNIDIKTKKLDTSENKNITSGKNLNIDVKGSDIKNNGKILAKEDLFIKGENISTSEGTIIYAGNDMTLEGNDLNNSFGGTLLTLNGDLNLNFKGDIRNSANETSSGLIKSGRDLNIKAKNLYNESKKYQDSEKGLYYTDVNYIKLLSINTIKILNAPKLNYWSQNISGQGGYYGGAGKTNFYISNWNSIKGADLLDLPDGFKEIKTERSNNADLSYRYYNVYSTFKFQEQENVKGSRFKQGIIESDRETNINLEENLENSGIINSNGDMNINAKTIKNITDITRIAGAIDSFKAHQKAKITEGASRGLWGTPTPSVLEYYSGANISEIKTKDILISSETVARITSGGDLQIEGGKILNVDTENNVISQEEYDSFKKAEKIERNKETIDKLTDLKFEIEENKNNGLEERVLTEFEIKKINDRLLSKNYLEIYTGDSGLFKVNEVEKKPVASKPIEDKPIKNKPLIETNVEFIDVDDFYGLDYFAEKTKYFPERTQRQLGDAYYETALINKVVTSNFGNLIKKESLDEGLFMKSLLDNAVDESKLNSNLKIGQPLTQKDIEELTKNIVWYVEIEVNGEKVLAPQLYIAKNGLKDFQDNHGSTISGKNIKIDEDFVKNSGGNIIAENRLDINAGTVTNVSNGSRGVLKGNETNIASVGDILNRGGTISGNKKNILSSSFGSVINETTKGKISSNISGLYEEKIDHIGKIESKGLVSISAEKDFLQKGAEIKGDSVNISANRDIKLEALDLKEKSLEKGGYEIKLKDSNRTLGNDYVSKIDKTEHKESVVFSDKELNLKSNKKVILAGASIEGENTSVLGKDGIHTKAVKNVEDKEYKSEAREAFYDETYEETSHTEKLLKNRIIAKNSLTIKSDKDIDLIGVDRISGGTTYIDSKDGKVNEQAVELTNTSKILHSKFGMERALDENSILEAASDADKILNNGFVTKELISKYGASGSVTVGFTTSNKEEDLKEVIYDTNKIFAGEQLIQGEKGVVRRGFDEKILGDSYIKSNDGNIEISSVENKLEKNSKENKFSLGMEYGYKVPILSLIENLGKRIEYSKNSEFSAYNAEENGKESIGKEVELGLRTLETLGDLTKISSGTDIGSLYTKFGITNSNVEKNISSTKGVDNTSSVGGKSSYDSKHLVSIEGLQGESTDLDIKAKDFRLLSNKEKISKDEYGESYTLDVEINGGVDIDGANAGVQVNFDGSIVDNKSHEVINNLSKLKAKNKVNLTVDRDATVEGLIEGDEIEARVGRNLTIKSKQDTIDSTTHTVNSNASGGIVVSTNGILPTGSIGTTYGLKQEKKSWVKEQAGIVAKNSLDLKSKVINLTGALLGSLNKNSTKILSDEINVENLKDSHNKFEFYAGGGAGFGKKGTSSVNIKAGIGEGFNKAQDTNSTLGTGEILTSSSLEKVNRDFGKSQVNTKDFVIGNFDFDYTLRKSATPKSKNKASKDLSSIDNEIALEIDSKRKSATPKSKNKASKDLSSNDNEIALKIDSKKLFQEAKEKYKNRDSNEEALKKLEILTKNAKSIPKEHLVKAIEELNFGLNMDDLTKLQKEARTTNKKVLKPDTIEEIDSKGRNNIAKIYNQLDFDKKYIETRENINDSIYNKLITNPEFNSLMNSKLSGDKDKIEKLFYIVESAKHDSLKEVTGISGERATVKIDENAGPLKMGQGYYDEKNSEVNMNIVPMLSFLKGKKSNNKEILDTIIHELTHHDQNQFVKNRGKNKIDENIATDVSLFTTNQLYYMPGNITNIKNYKNQPLEREAFASGHELSKKLTKQLEEQNKKSDIVIEHIPTKNTNLESSFESNSNLGKLPLIYGTSAGRKELANVAKKSENKDNTFYADSYIGKLNLGIEFSNLKDFAEKVRDGKITEAEIDEISKYSNKFLNDSDSLSTAKINYANVEDNKNIINELLKNEVAVEALKKIADISLEQRALEENLKKYPEVDLDNPKASKSFTDEANDTINKYLDNAGKLDDSFMDFFAEKTKLVAKENLDKGGKIYMALDGIVTSNRKDEDKVDFDKLKDAFDVENPYYNSVTSREIRFLHENYKDNPNIKFTIKKQVIENPFNTQENLKNISSNVASENKKEAIIPIKTEYGDINLTNKNIEVIKNYIESGFFVNENLRENKPLTDKEKEFVKNMDEALKKMPNYKGDVQRVLYIPKDSNDDLEKFLDSHKEGNIVKYDAYTSTARADIKNSDLASNIVLSIKDTHSGKDVTYFNKDEGEVIFERGTEFVVNKVTEKNGMYYIEMSESKNSSLDVASENLENNVATILKPDTDKLLDTLVKDLEEVTDNVDKNRTSLKDIVMENGLEKLIVKSEAPPLLYGNPEDYKDMIQKDREKNKKRNSNEENLKKLDIIAKNAKNIPKEHLVKAIGDLYFDDLASDSKGQKNITKIYNQLDFDKRYMETRESINDSVFQKLITNPEFNSLMNSKLAGDKEKIEKLFYIVENAKHDSLEEITGISGERATIKIDENAGPLKMDQGYYDEIALRVNVNIVPKFSFLKSQKSNNKEILDTIIHELTHHDQNKLIRNISKNKIDESIATDVSLFATNQLYYIPSELTNMKNYKNQPLEKEAFASGHDLSKKLMKYLEEPNVEPNIVIEHIPTKNTNLEGSFEGNSNLGKLPLIYGTSVGRIELANAAKKSENKDNVFYADSYVGKLNLGINFSHLKEFAEKVKDGKITEFEIDEIAKFNDTLLNSSKNLATAKINYANTEDNKNIINRLLENEIAVEALKNIVNIPLEQEILERNIKEHVNLGAAGLSEQLPDHIKAMVKKYLGNANKLDDAFMDFFAEKTKLVAKENLDKGGKIYMALDGIVTTNRKGDDKVDFDKLKDAFDAESPYYNSVTSREIRFLHENYKDNPNIKFTIKKQVIENPFNTQESLRNLSKQDSAK